MKEEKFKVLKYVRDFIIALDKEMDNFPKKDIEIKNKIRMNAFELLQNVYKANEAKDIKRKLIILEDSKASIKVVDFLINLSVDKNIISSKKYYKLGDRMNDIEKYINGWINSIRPSNERDSNKVDNTLMINIDGLVEN